MQLSKGIRKINFKMKKFKKILLHTHFFLKKIFFKIAYFILEITIFILGFSFMFPLVKIYVDVYDNKFSIFNSLMYIGVGILCFYLGLGFKRIDDILNKNLE